MATVWTSPPPPPPIAAYWRLVALSLWALPTNWWTGSWRCCPTQFCRDGSPCFDCGGESGARRKWPRWAAWKGRWWRGGRRTGIWRAALRYRSPVWTAVRVAENVSGSTVGFEVCRFQTFSVSDRQSGRSTRSVCSLPFSGAMGVRRSCKRPQRSRNNGWKIIKLKRLLKVTVESTQYKFPASLLH